MIRNLLVGLLALTFLTPAFAGPENRIKDSHRRGVFIKEVLKVYDGSTTVDVLSEVHALDAQRLPFTLFLQGTLGNPTGPASDGVLIGTITDGAAICAQDDGTVFTDYTTECVSGDGDIIMLPVVAEAEDAFYIGHATSPFAKVSMDTTSGVQGVTTMTVAWEYYNVDTTWDTLTFGRQDVIDFDEAVGAHINTFQPPSDWALTTINSVAGYYIRMRVTAFTSSGTDATADIITVGPTTTGTGITMPSDATITTVGFTASTVSGTNADSTFLVMNLTQGTHSLATFTKTLIVDNDDITDLAFTAGDTLAVLQLQEDGTTEHADVMFISWLDL